MAREPVVLNREDWATEADQWVGRFEGGKFGADVTVLFFSSERVGAGPPLHLHPYDEVFIIRQGHARFTVGEKTLTAKAGQIVFAPRDTPHKFVNLGPGRLETTDIHLSDRFIQTDLE
ncbi:MAG: cupin domain-containing protein [Pseudomonadota bacterium]